MHGVLENEVMEALESLQELPETEWAFQDVFYHNDCDGTCTATCQGSCGPPTPCSGVCAASLQ